MNSPANRGPVDQPGRVWSLVFDWAGDEGVRDPVLAIVEAPDLDTARVAAEDAYILTVNGQPTCPLPDLAYLVAAFTGDLTAVAAGDLDIADLRPNRATGTAG